MLSSSRCVLVLAFSVGVAAVPALRAEPQKTAATTHAAMEKLEMFLGHWTVTEHHYDARGKIIATVTGSEDVRWLLDEKAIQRTYTSSSDSAVYRAIGTMTWSVVDGSYRGVWFDNVSVAGPTEVRGRWDSKRKALVMEYSVAVGKDEQKKFNVIERFTDDSTRLATTFEIVDEKVVKLTEVEYKRSAPCPAKIRMIYDDIHN